MPKTVNKIIQEKMTGHQIGLLRLSSGITNKLVVLLNRTEDDIIQQLSRLENERLNYVLRDVREVLKAAKVNEYDLLKTELTDLSHYEPKYVEQVISGAMPVKFDMTMPSTDLLSKIVTARPFQGKLLKEWIEDLSESRRRSIRNAIREGMVEGETIGQMTRRIKGTRANKYQDGLMQISRRGARTMVRTAVNHTATHARELTYLKNEDLISKIQIIATLDANTTPICQDLDGKVFPVGKGPRPPFHYGCRTTTAPITKSFRELGFDIDEAPAGTRASMNGQVSAKTNYNAWLKGQSEKVQDDVLGPGRGKMFREGATVHDFVDKSGKSYTIKQLEKMDVDWN